MRFYSWFETLFDAKVNPDAVAFKPNASAFEQVRRLRHFRNSENAAIKFARRLLAAFGHRELNMMNASNVHD